MPVSTSGTVPKRAAFTLIELLAVLAILALLVSLLSPAVRQAMHSSHGAVCRSNLRQLGQGMLSHARDYGGYLPFYGHPATFNLPEGSGRYKTGGAQWDVQTMPYVGMEEWTWGRASPPPELGLRPTVFYCPGVKPAFIDNRPTQYVWSKSYCYNRRVGEDRRGSRSLATLEDPQRTFLLMDSVHASVEPWTDRSGYLGRGHTGTIRYQENTTEGRRIYAYRHQGHAHLLFADGHADARPPNNDWWPIGVTFGNGYRVYE